MGLAWSLFNPVFMLLVYTFVFSVVFEARWGMGAEESKVHVAMALFVGMIVHALFAEVVNRSPSLILANANYVKKVVFPLEILPWIAMGSALFHFFVSLAVLLAAFLLFSSYLPWTVMLFPIVVLPVVLGTMGLAWALAATGVFLRDFGHAAGMFTTAMLFLSPVFYPMSALPEQYQTLLMLNPLTFIIETSRGLLFGNKMASWSVWAAYCGASVVIAWGGFFWFQRTRRGFADVI